jgi:hypothetical protein
MKDFFKSPHIQETLESVGFVKTALLKISEVDKINELYNSTIYRIAKPNNNFYSISDTDNHEVIRELNLSLKAVLQPAFDRQFKNFDLILSTFLIKEPGPSSDQLSHEDWSYTDEQNFFALNIWIPLQDTSIHNGCMWFIPSSHRFIDTLRPSPSYPWAYASCERGIRKLKESVSMKKGECLVFFHRTIHGSYPNRSGKSRIAVGNLVLENEAPLNHYYLFPNGELVKYELTMDQYIGLSKSCPPKEYVNKSAAFFDFPQISDFDFTRLYFENNKSIVRRALSRVKLLGG